MRKIVATALVGLLVFSAAPLLVSSTAKADPLPAPIIDRVEPAQPRRSDTREPFAVVGSDFVLGPPKSMITLEAPNDRTFEIPRVGNEFIDISADGSRINVQAGFTVAGTWQVWVTNPDGQKSNVYEFDVRVGPTAAIDEGLLTLIDTYISEDLARTDDERRYYRDDWQISPDQYKAWIATIAWGEGGRGGYGAHSILAVADHRLPEFRDVFNHVRQGRDFRFCTGVGPFQIDNGGSPGHRPAGGHGVVDFEPTEAWASLIPPTDYFSTWCNWPTIKKLDPVSALETTMTWHFRMFGSGSQLKDFSERSAWFAVKSYYWLRDKYVEEEYIERRWNEVTGCFWNAHREEKRTDFAWAAVREQLAENAANYGNVHSYEHYVEYLGPRLWTIERRAATEEDEGRDVSFEGWHPTWRITPHNHAGGTWHGSAYYYTFEFEFDEDNGEIVVGNEVWVMDNIGTDENELCYVFFRDYTDNQYPIPVVPARALTTTTAGETLTSRALVLDPLDEPPVTPTRALEVVLNIDRSGSMRGQKMTDAKIAANMLVDLLSPHDRVALVSFASSASVDMGLTSNIGDVKTAIARCSASGSTNMGDALGKAIKELTSNAREDSILSIIYFTDGVTNTGPSKSHILNVLVPEAAEAGIIIHTLGYGRDVDGGFLRQVAEGTGGKYYFAPDRAKLLEIYTELSQMVKGIGKVAEFAGSVKQGEVERETFLLQLKTLFIRVFLLWPGSDLDLAVIDPSGRRLVPGPRVIYSGSDAFPEYYEIHDPQPGEWTIEVYGREVTGEAEDYTIMVFRPEALMQVRPMNCAMDYPDDRRATITVREIAGMVNLESVEFTVSDLTGTGDNVIPSRSFSFSPNRFTIRAGETRDVQMSMRAPRGTPIGDYAGTIEVTSGDASATIGLVVRVTSEDTSLLGGHWWALIGVMIALAVVVRLVVVFMARREPVLVGLPQGSSCPACGDSVLSGANFCSSCAAKLKPPPARTTERVAPVCSRCGYRNVPGARFCEYCGMALP